MEPEEEARQWARTSLDEFSRLAELPESNVHIIPVIVLGSEQLPENPGKAFLPHFKDGHDALQEAHRCLWAETPTQKKYVDAQYYHAPVCNSAKYLAWMQRQIRAMGGRIVTRTIQSIDEAISSDARIVVNCSGLGSKDIVPDAEVYPARGELLHVTAPWVQAAVFEDPGSGYVIPCPGSDLELGGTLDDHACDPNMAPF